MKNTSVWGPGENITLKTIEHEIRNGKWLNLGAGDGRYTKKIVNKADELILADIDKSKLKKAKNLINEKKKIKLKIFDMTKTFPFDDNAFDGVFCTGTLHLFSPKKIKSILIEVDRILKPYGKIILDFATDIKRTFKNKPNKKFQTPKYTFDKAKSMLKKNLINYELKIKKSKFKDDLTDKKEHGFKTSGNFFLIIGRKNK